MYYLHQLDGSRFHRDTFIQISQDATPPHVPHTVGNSPLVNQDGSPLFFDNGWRCGPIPSETEAITLATIIARHYNFGILTAEDVAAADALLARHDVHAAAALLGRSGGHSTSHAKAEAARRNGQRGGRPRNNRSNTSMTTLQCAAGSRENPIHATVQFSGTLTAAIALDAARRAFGHASGVTVTDPRDGTTYRCTAGKARKVKRDPELWMD
jgi:hypothetical protein